MGNKPESPISVSFFFSFLRVFLLLFWALSIYFVPSLACLLLLYRWCVTFEIWADNDVDVFFSNRSFFAAYQLYSISTYVEEGTIICSLTHAQQRQQLGIWLLFGRRCISQSTHTRYTRWESDRQTDRPQKVFRINCVAAVRRLRGTFWKKKKKTDYL